MNEPKMRTLPGRIYNIVGRSIRRKLILMTTSLLLISVLSIGLFSYFDTAETIESDVLRFSVRVIKQTNLNLDRYFMEFDYAFKAVAASPSIRRWLRSAQSGAGNGGIQPADVNLQAFEAGYIEPLFRNHPEMLTISIYNGASDELRYANPGNQKHVSHAHAGKTDPFLDGSGSAPHIRYRVDYGSVYTDSGSAAVEEIPLLTVFRRVDVGSDRLYIKAEIEMSVLDDIVQQLTFGGGAIGYICSEDGVILSHPDAGRIMSRESPELTEQFASREYGSIMREYTGDILFFRTIPSTGWKTVVSIQHRDVARGVYHVRNTTVLVTAAGLASALLVAIVMSATFTRRIRQLRKAMAEMTLDRFNERVPVAGNDEVADLARAYNIMLQRLETSLKHLSETRQQKLQAELQVMQAQMNPHFLYNTLSSIGNLAKLGRIEDMYDLIEHLAAFYRYTLNNGKTVVTVAGELRQIRAYCAIQLKKYRSRLTVVYDIDDRALQAETINMVLQPFVENALKHAWNGERILLTIGVRLNCGRLELRVSDDGLGMEESVIRRIFDPNVQSGGYGIRNVHERIQLLFGPEWGVKIDSVVGQGTTVLIFIPVKLPE